MAKNLNGEEVSVPFPLSPPPCLSPRLCSWLTLFIYVFFGVHRASMSLQIDYPSVKH